MMKITWLIKGHDLSKVVPEKQQTLGRSCSNKETSSSGSNGLLSRSGWDGHQEAEPACLDSWTTSCTSLQAWRDRVNTEGH